MKKLGIQIRKTREFIGFCIEKADVYYDRMAGVARVYYGC